MGDLAFHLLAVWPWASLHTFGGLSLLIYEWDSHEEVTLDWDPRMVGNRKMGWSRERGNMDGVMRCMNVGSMRGPKNQCDWSIRDSREITLLRLEVGSKQHHVKAVIRISSQAQEAAKTYTSMLRFLWHSPEKSSSLQTSFKAFKLGLYSFNSCWEINLPKVMTWLKRFSAYYCLQNASQCLRQTFKA